MQPIGPLEQIFFATARLLFPTGPTTAAFGTGFLLRAEVMPGRAVIFIVSNNHVFDSHDTVVFDLTKRTTDGRADLGNVKRFSLSDLQAALIRHPDPSIDLACFNVSSYVESHSLFKKWITEKELRGFSMRQIMPGATIHFAGYPANRFDTKHNLPLLRTGTIASIPSVDFCGQRVFAVDATSHKGSSGSPVMASVDGDIKLLGVFTGFMNSDVAGPSEPIHAGLVIRFECVAELVAHALEVIRKQLAAQST